MNEMCEKIKRCRGTQKYDDDLNKICSSIDNAPFFGVLHQELLPYIGQYFKKTEILLVGESHYVKKATQEQWNATNWYHKPLTANGENPFNKEDAKNWFDTRQVLVRYMTGERGKGHIIFSRPTEVLEELSLGTGDKFKDFDHFAFMNFFQRPALNYGKSIVYTEEDKQVANDIIKQVISILRPKMVIFLSKKAYSAFNKCFNDIPIKFVSHPNSAWWYRLRRDGKCAKADFKKYLQSVLLTT